MPIPKKYFTQENFQLLVDVIKMEGVEMLQNSYDLLQEDNSTAMTHLDPDTLEGVAGRMFDQAKLLKAVKLVENIYGVGRIWSPFSTHQKETQENAKKIKANFILYGNEDKETLINGSR